MPSNPLHNRIFKSKIFSLTLILIGISFLAFSIIHEENVDAAGRRNKTAIQSKEAPFQDEQLEKLFDKKIVKDVTKNKNVKVRNAGTPHVFLVSKSSAHETSPYLSKSTFTGEETGAGKAMYIINLINNGNANATDIDIFNEIDERFNAPKNFVFSNCGNRYINSSEEGALDLSNIFVKKGKRCTITYEVVLKENRSGIDLMNSLYISPAAEGGEEIGPIDAEPLLIAPIVEPTEEPVTEPDISDELS